MANYSGNSSNYATTVYIINATDPIAGGLAGYDNLPNIDLEDRKTYLKKYKGTIFHGSGDPSGTESIDFDVNSIDNVLYLNTITGSFWKVSDISTPTWTNITKNVVLNVEDIQINDTAVSTTAYGFFNHNVIDTRLDALNQDNKIANIKMNNIQFDSADGYSYNQLHNVDSEMQVNADIEQESENTDGYFGVQNFGSDTGDELTKYWKWDESSASWIIEDKDGTQLTLNFKSLYINNIEVIEDIADYIIYNQDLFDAVFNQGVELSTSTIDTTGTYDGTNNGLAFSVDKNDVNFIYLKSGTYILDNIVSIRKQNVKILCSAGATIQIDENIINGVGNMVIDADTGEVPFEIGSTPESFHIDTLFDVSADNTELILNIDGSDGIITNLIDNNTTGSADNCIYDIKLKNITLDNSIVKLNSNINNIVKIIATTNNGVIASTRVDDANQSIIEGIYENDFAGSNLIVNNMNNKTLQIGTGIF